MREKSGVSLNEEPKYKKKSKAKGLARAKHKHQYETVLLIRNYHHKDCKTGAPKITQTSSPTKVCTICGRIDCVDYDRKYYEPESQSENKFPWIVSSKLNAVALSLPKWHTQDFFDKFAHKGDSDEIG